MPRNIEIKAYARNFDAIRRLAESLSDFPCEVVVQDDVFFPVDKGRLKLRRLASNRGQLIYYNRADSKGPKRSEYCLTETNDPGGLKNVLAQAYGVRGTVKKTRYLYLAGQTRIHLDEVENLGKFVELEVVLRPGQPDEEGRTIAEELMRCLGIAPDDLIEDSYVDLFERNKK